MKKAFVVLAVVALLASFTVPALAKFPARPVQLVVPWPSASPNIPHARIVAEEMSKHLGQKIVVSAIPGGSAAKGLKHVLAAPADGYTILDAWVAGLIFVPLTRGIESAGFSYKDFTPVGHASFQPFTLMVRKDSPWKTLDDFVKDNRSSGKLLKYNAAAALSVPHGVMAAFLQKAGLKAQGVPYQGIAGGFKDFLGGTLDFSLGTFSFAKIYADQTRTLCAFTPERSPINPNIPTAQEYGYGLGWGRAAMGWNSWAVKKGTPDDRVKVLADAFKKAATNPVVLKKLKDLGSWYVYMDQAGCLKLWEDSMVALKSASEAIKKEQAMFGKQ